MSIPKPTDPVAEVFAGYPTKARAKLEALRQLVYEVAARHPGIGPLTETLKWGEPAYLTEKTKAGSTIRMAWKEKNPDYYALYFICHTHLVDTFRTLYPELTFEGNRAMVFKLNARLPKKAVSHCVEMALTYHLSQRQQANQ